jgi:hypothetical protein
MLQLIQQMENYTECWKQFIYFLNVARAKKFGNDEENQFLELKTVIVQHLEIILAKIETGAPSKDEVLALIGAAPSLRYLSEMNEGSLRNLECNWHKLYIGWHSVLGQLKVQHRFQETRSIFGSLFSRAN